MKIKIKEIQKPAYFYYIFKKYKENVNFPQNYLSIPIYDDLNVDILGFSPYLDEVLSIEELELNKVKDEVIKNGLYAYCMEKDNQSLIEKFNESKFIEWFKNQTIKPIKEKENEKHDITKLDSIFGGIK